MTRSADLLTRARRAATTGPDAGSDLARITLELADELDHCLRPNRDAPRSEELIARGKKLLMGSSVDMGCIAELCEELRIQVRANLRLEAVVHEATK